MVYMVSYTMISPPLEENPQYTLKGKTLIIDLKECHLDSNTTYIILCNQAIKDYTEGNLLPDKNIVFSTGDYIDSMCLCHRVSTCKGKKQIISSTNAVYIQHFAYGI